MEGGWVAHTSPAMETFAKIIAPYFSHRLQPCLVPRGKYSEVIRKWTNDTGMNDTRDLSYRGHMIPKTLFVDRWSGTVYDPTPTKPRWWDNTRNLSNQQD